MPSRTIIDIDRVLKTTLGKLRSERERLDRQIASLETALRVDSLPGYRRTQSAATAPRRRRVSAAQRKAISQRMKALWAKRRAKRKGRRR